MCYNALINNKLLTNYALPSDNESELLEIADHDIVIIDIDFFRLCTIVNHINNKQDICIINVMIYIVMIYSFIAKIKVWKKKN